MTASPAGDGAVGPGMGSAITEAIPEKVGNLTVDIFDGNAKQLI